MKKFTLVFLVLMLLAAALLFWARRGTLPVAQLLDYFPASDDVVAWVDVEALRSGGVLKLIAGSKAVHEPEYLSFVQQSGFDYARDLDGVLVTVRGDDVYMLLTGRFPWDKLESYVENNGGSCKAGVCLITGSQPSRKISFSSIRSGVMALAVSPNDSAVTAVLTRKNHPRTVRSEQPVWISVPPSVLQRTGSTALLPGTRPFTSALSKAETVTLSIGPQEGRFEAFLEVTCPTPGDAAFLQLQLQEATELLKSLISRENQHPNPNDLSGVLTAGTFGRNDRHVWGKWPIERGFVQALAGGAL